MKTQFLFGKTSLKYLNSISPTLFLYSVACEHVYCEDDFLSSDTDLSDKLDMFPKSKFYSEAPANSVIDL